MNSVLSLTKKRSLPIFWNVEVLLSLYNNVIIFTLNVDCLQRTMIKTESLSSWRDYDFVNYKKLVVKKPFGFSKSRRMRAVVCGISLFSAVTSLKDFD